MPTTKEEYLAKTKSIGKDAAIALGKTGWWKGRPAWEVAMRQHMTVELCMNFGDFQKAMQDALGRSVWTHEFAEPQLLYDELMGDREPPTFGDILELIPAEKRIVIGI